jgi:hypothetical protein
MEAGREWKVMTRQILKSSQPLPRRSMRSPKPPIEKIENNADKQSK